jgi:hypothetical protein
MNAKILLPYLLIAFLVPTMPGCVTAATSRCILQKQTDRFVLRSFYKSRTDGGLALEGTCKDRQEFLIFPQKALVVAHGNSGGDVTFSDISALPPATLKHLQLTEKLPSNYERVYDFPERHRAMNVNETTHVRVGCIVALPFALAFDAVTWPAQVALLRALRDELNQIN